MFFELQLLQSVRTCIVESPFFHSGLASGVKVVGQGLEEGNTFNF